VDVVNAVWSTATLLPPVSTGAAAAYRTLYMTARRAVLGRTLTVPLPGGDVRLTVTELSSRLDPRRLALGQGEDVRLTASDIRWQNGVFERATALLRNVQLRPGAPPTLRAQAVELTVEVGSDALADLLASVTRRWTGEIDDAGVVRLRWARRPRWANVEVDAAVEDGPGPVLLRLTPRALAIGTRRWALPGGDHPATGGFAGHRYAVRTSAAAGAGRIAAVARPGAVAFPAAIPGGGPRDGSAVS
jgi:hypothetical protein